MTKAGFVAAAVLVMVAVTGCTAQRKANLAAQEAAIRATDASWLAAATSHDLERILPFWSDDATILPPGAPAVVGKEAIRQYVSGAFATPGFSITWTTDTVEVSQSGDLAYSAGTDRISVTAPDGKSVTEVNRGVAIWKKQPDGSWKCVMDVMSPAAALNAGAPRS
ncbi:MAG TPA: SgcJ/EcaC family oxidoreductase [Candidatus Acidoferrales bacterium]|nr:SgcJ/EcaC family oxidoreductase [Candidatus Acidoferrales bacterium]